MKLYPHIFTLLLIQPCCKSKSKDSQIDIGPRLHESGRPAYWSMQSKHAIGTKFIYSAGPSLYLDEEDKNPDFYTIDVQLKHENGISEVFFSRDFRIEDLPDGFLNKKIDDFASFDTKNSRITFQIGNKEYVFSLPK